MEENRLYTNRPIPVETIVEQIRKERPIVHCITNAVTVNDCANILLAAGASPTMAHHPLEVAEITEGAAALVCNFGAIADYEAMLAAGYRARERHHAIVVDPVGVSGSTYRRNQCSIYIKSVHPTCVRGNYSEIKALIEQRKTVTGVDASGEELQAADYETMIQQMKGYAAREQLILIASGETDILTDGQTVYFCENGDPLMARITGAGCMSSAMLGAFLGIDASLESAVACCSFMGIAGELAAERTQICGGGTMTFRDQLIDRVSLMETEQLLGRVKVRQI